MTITRPDYTGAMKTWYDAAESLWEPWARAWQPKPACGCRKDADHPCGCDPCTCCTPDCDVLVQTRVGERRIVPLTLHNPTRRPRTVTLDVGPFSPCGDPTDLVVHAVVLPGKELQLEPCERRTVELVLTVGGAQEHKPTKGGTDAVRLPTVDRCTTLVADVRFGGCGSRAVRIAAVVLPAPCGGYAVDCDCGCC